jgi:hypothetical protein
MVIVECPWCLGPVALSDDDSALSCDACSISVDIATDDGATDVARAA